MVESDFREVLAVLDGARHPLDARASKVLAFMLEQREGCDATIEPGRFEIRFGWNPARHRYLPGLAPAVLSYLLELAGAPRNGDVQAVIGPAAVPSVAFEYSWSFDHRRVWISRRDESLSIRVRDVGPGESFQESLPEPAPIDFPGPTFLDPASPVSCPTCSAQSSRYRVLAGGFLVCSSCGCSFAIPPEIAAEPRVAADGAAPRR